MTLKRVTSKLRKSAFLLELVVRTVHADLLGHQRTRCP
eukprot:CAMPEP_0194516066 /NCGR_PEP_ID=MMETSP0253-20130528/48854_1 /TAXON_ID=2966 /ORGANISM="Noctiluca scintillans" /LENGTH=37 /DNA_ID= /DNA_START= /DNA_END= /DNA_ORIENTATION=